MRSRTASDTARAQRERLAQMTPEERLALSQRLSEEGLRAYMATHNLDRRAAVWAIRATRRLGRRLSASADADVR